MKTTNRKNTNLAITLGLALGLALLGGAAGLTSVASGSGAATPAAPHAVAQFELYVYTFSLTYYDGSTVVHQEGAWETVARDPAEANAYASNHLAVVTQRLEAQGHRISRSSGVIISSRPLNPRASVGKTAENVEIAPADFRAFAAICATGHGTAGWYGPSRTTYAEATRDAQGHEKSFPGHDAEVTSLGQSMP